MCILVNAASIHYNESADMITHELHHKSVAETFWNAEIEGELSQIGYIFSSVDSRENLMDAIDKERAKCPYVHDDCTDECKKRGELTAQNQRDIATIITHFKIIQATPYFYMFALFSTINGKEDAFISSSVAPITILKIQQCDSTN